MNATITATHPPVDHALLHRHATCSCGQELDVCRHAHCPRCGQRVTDRGQAAPSPT